MIENSNYWKNRPLNDSRYDWRNGGINWVYEYVQSKSHPHRRMIVDAIDSLPLSNDMTLLEIGCNAGPNIALIRDELPTFKDGNIYGLDINKDAIKAAKSWMPKVHWKVGSILELPYKDKTMDVVLIDACLMYINDKEIGKAMMEIDRVCSRSVVICDWFSKTEEVKDFHWSRNYKVILEDLGYKVKKIKIKEKDWPSKIWQKNGYVFIGKR